MKKRVRIDIACNDPDNGLFDGKAGGISYGDATFEPNNWDGYAFTDGGDFIRLHRRKYRVQYSKHWIGNWCWNGFVMERSEAKRLLKDLRASGRWTCTCGPARLFTWFNREAA